jgi:hypothetical protein
MRYGFEGDQFVNLATLKQIAKTLEDSFGKFGFSGFSPREQQIAEVKLNGKLSLGQFDGINITYFNVDAILPPANATLSDLQRILEGGHIFLGKPGTGLIQVTTSFLEKSSNEKSDGSSILAEYRDGKANISLDFPFRGPKSRASGFDVAGQYVSEVIKAAELPLEVFFDSGVYFVKDPSETRLKIIASGGSDKRGRYNPSAFACEMPGATPADLVRRMQLVLDQFAKPGSARFGWGALAGIKTSPETVQEALRFLISLNLPAKRIDLTLFFTLQSIEGIELLHQIAGPKNSFVTSFCRFGLPNPAEPNLEEGAELGVHTTAAGHRLNGSITSLESLKLVEKALGMKLTWNNPD